MQAAPHHRRNTAGRWNTLIAVSIAAFMLLLDITGMNIALPDIQREPGASFDDLRWVIDACALTLAATMLISGSLGDRYGRRLVFTRGSPCSCVGTWLKQKMTTKPSSNSWGQRNGPETR